MIHITRYKYLFGILLSGVISSGWALPDDNDQPIHIASDQALLYDTQGISTYTGNVEITQGSIVLKADKVTIYSENAKITRVEANGKPAHFQQRPAADQSIMHAYGETINYELAREVVTLTVQARLENDENSFTGNRIQYDIKNQKIQAYADNNSENEGQRVEMIIQPKPQNSAGE